MTKSKFISARDNYKASIVNYNKALDAHISGKYGMGPLEPGSFWTGRAAYKAKKNMISAAKTYAAEKKKIVDYSRKRK